MKFSTLSIATLATAIASVSASFFIDEPWGESTWTAGGNGTVAWNSTSDESGKWCEIHLLTGDPAAATFVANLTANDNLVPCNYTKAVLYPLPDYPAGEYFIRLGPNGASMDLYSYSGNFKYIGNGTVPAHPPIDLNSTDTNVNTDPVIPTETVVPTNPIVATEPVSQPATPVESNSATTA